MVEAGTFDNLPTLTSLRLDNNTFTKLPAGLFSNLKNLAQFDASDSKLETIPRGLFTDHPALEEIQLFNNSIVDLEEEAFGRLPLLRSVELSSNKLTSLSGPIFQGLNSVTELSIASNNLHMFPSNLHGADQLQTLFLGNNPIRESLGPGQFSAIPRLSKLSLSNISYLQSVGTLEPTALCGLDVLDSLDLSYNGLIDMTPNTFECTPTITELYLHHNNLTFIVSSLFHSLTQLVSLDLSFNQLSYMDPDTFLGLDKLFSLDLTGNNFTNMAHVSPALANLPVFKVYVDFLYENPFVYLGPESFPTPMKNATGFDIAFGHIRVVDEGTFSATYFPNLTRLQLTNNPLRFLPASAVDKLPNPPSLRGKDLQDVPLADLTCDCQHEEAPSIDTRGSDTSVHEGQTAMLKCKISGCPEAEFFWTTPTGAMLAVDSGFPRMEVLDNGTLVVTKAREEDTGVYTCTAVNYRGKAIKEVPLVVTGF
ncbi:hypothetical protein Bbelb_303690 [Branchiostoma belcheri]|nr:hypothetical protein Bbelb_303690 [Branchiostoma belcheri]